MKEFGGLILTSVGVLVMIFGGVYFILDSGANSSLFKAVLWVGLVIFFIGVLALIQTSKDAKRRQDFNAAQAVLEAIDLPNCPVCGSNNFSWGDVFAYIRFRSKQGRRMPVLARRCDHCGHLDLFDGTVSLPQFSEDKAKRKRQPH